MCVCTVGGKKKPWLLEERSSPNVCVLLEERSSPNVCVRFEERSSPGFCKLLIAQNWLLNIAKRRQRNAERADPCRAYAPQMVDNYK